MFDTPVYTVSTPSSDHDSLQEMLYKLFHSLLMYSLQEEQDGWSVWVETAAAMHIFVSEAVSAY